MYYSFFSSLPIKRIFPILTGCILILLLGVIALGTRQYMLYSQCTNAVATSDKLLFEFTALQKYLSESLVASNQVNVSRVSEKFEQLNAMTSELKANTLVADSLKNGLVPRDDYVGLVADLQMMQDNPAVLKEKKIALIQQLNTINNRLQSFRISLSDYTQAILQGLHNIIIGILGLLFVLTCTLLYTLSRYIGPSLVRLVNITFKDHKETFGKEKAKYTLDDLTFKVSSVMATQQRLSNVVNSLKPLAPSIGKQLTTQQLQQKICDALITNPDFTFVWIGALNEKNILHPTCCSESTVSRNVCLQALKESLVHCEQDGHIFQPVWQSLQTEHLVEQQFNISSFPVELGDFDDQYHQIGTSITFPLLYNSSHKTIIAIYSPLTDSFPPEYLDFLSTILNHTFSFANRQQELLTQPETITAPQHFQRYCYTASGAICNEFASSITNLVNGTINYTQQLIDLSEQVKTRPEAVKILGNMLVEEKKIARLTANMLLAGGKYQSKGTGTTLNTFIKGISAVFEKPLQSEAIELLIDCPDDCTVKIPINTLWLITLTILQLGRTSLLQDASGSKKSISIACSQNSVKQQLFIQYANSTKSWDITTLQNHPIWPSLDYCTQLMQQNHGDLTLHGEEELLPHTLTLSLPY